MEEVKDIEWDYSAYIGYLEDSIVEQIREMKLVSAIYKSAFTEKEKNLMGFIEALCADDCPEEYKNLIYRETFNKERK